MAARLFSKLVTMYYDYPKSAAQLVVQSPTGSSGHAVAFPRYTSFGSSDMQYLTKTAIEQLAALRKREISAVELLEQTIAHAEKVDPI